MVSTASWAPWKSGNPFAMTSMRRLSTRSTEGRFRSVSKVFVVTRAPASRHILAAARSRGQPRLRRAPDRGQAARWSPRGSRTRRHRQWRSVSGSGRRRRLRSRTRKRWLGYLGSGAYGMVVKVRLPNGPDWEAIMAWLAGSRVR